MLTSTKAIFFALFSQFAVYFDAKKKKVYRMFFNIIFNILIFFSLQVFIDFFIRVSIEH